jgi:spore coat protein CotH
MNRSETAGTNPLVAAMALIVLMQFPLFPQTLPRVEITIAQDSIDVLEAAPFADIDVHGDFTAEDTTRFNNVAIHYRGAYHLWELIEDPDIIQRNWKIKFPKDNRYRNRREWNFNYESHLRQKLTYDIFERAGVAAPSARHVILQVNGVRHGLFLEYEDPDNKDWLRDKFGDQSGDLFKAGFDMPDTPSYFALLTDLGDSSSNYYLHYDKKTNNDSIDSLDYSSLIKFIKTINYSPQESFPDSIKKHFNVQSFLRYLVIANFINHWDSYPTRPKNYWLYNNPSDHRWSFIPWDLDLTFQKKITGSVTLDTTLSVFYQLLAYEPFKGQPNEGTERPLTRRMFQYAEFLNGYISEYRVALDSYLNAPYLLSRVDSLSAAIKQDLTDDESTTFVKSVNPMKTFIASRYTQVKKQLDTINAAIRRPHGKLIPQARFSFTVHQVSSQSSAVVSFTIPRPGKVTIAVSDLAGRTIAASERLSITGTHTVAVSLSNRATGVYCVTAKFDGYTLVSKLMVR